MSRLLAAAAVGFLLGLRHAADPDHVLAMSALVARARRGSSWALGAAWGLGHTATLFAAGAAIILLRLSVSPRVEAAMEAAVGAMLVVLGTLSLRGGLGSWGLPEHSHEHDHGGEGHGHHLLDEGGAHSHAHAHSPAIEALARTGREAGPARLARSFAVGAAHGLAGSGAVALLVLAAIPDPAAALAYLVVFGLGTLSGMVLCSSALELALAWAHGRWGAGVWVSRAFGAATVAFGLYMMAAYAGG